MAEVRQHDIPGFFVDYFEEPVFSDGKFEVKHETGTTPFGNIELAYVFFLSVQEDAWVWDVGGIPEIVAHKYRDIKNKY